MKRVIIIVALIIVILIGAGLITQGIGNGEDGINVYSYDEIENKSGILTMAIAVYNKKNNTEYQAVLDNLDTAIDDYESAKEQYEDLLSELGTQEQIDEETEEVIVYSESFGVYEIDFLWATIGNYAKSEGLTITLDVSRSSTTGESLNYDLYNLSFIVTGEYINIADFLYDLEDDDQLAFEIRDYSMTAGVATFTVYNVPINSETLLEGTTTISSGTEDTEDDTESTNETNTAATNSVSSNSTNDTSSNTNNTTD